MPFCFKPIVHQETKILIIGTMPSTASLQANEYYAFPRNAFWRIIADICNIKDFKNYAEKQQALKSLNIGLWDNLQFCEREGSLDSKIEQEIPNDFETLLKQFPQIKKLLFNGQKSYQFFKKYHSKLLKEYKYTVLPSTSPANAGISYEEKYVLWKREIEEECF